MVRNEDFDNLTLNGDNVATGTDLDSKADQSEVDSLSSTVGSKADQDGGGTAELLNYAAVNTDELQTRTEPVVNVKAWGAVGDGSTDETAALNQVFDEVPSGAEVVFPSGEYRITEAVAIDTSKPLSITGIGDVTFILDGGHLDTSGGTEEATLTLDASANHLDTTLSVESIPANVEPGQQIRIQSDAAFESDWGNAVGEAAVISEIDETNATITIQQPIAYEYDPSTDSVDVTTHNVGRLDVENIDISVSDSSISRAFNISGVAPGSRLERVSIIDEGGGENCDGINLVSSVGVSTSNLHFEGLRYGFLVSHRTRSTRVEFTTGTNCRHLVSPAANAVDVLVDGLFGWGNLGALDAHPALRVTYRNFVVYDTDDRSNVRAAGSRIENGYIYTPDGSSTDLFSVSTISVNDRFTHITERYDTKISNIHIDAPNHSRQEDAVRLASCEHRSAEIEGCHLPGRVEISTPRSLGTDRSIVSDSTIEGRLWSRTARLTVDNCQFIGDGTQAAIRVDSNEEYWISHTRFVDWDSVITTARAYDRDGVFTSCKFDTIRQWGVDWIHTDEYPITFVACRFANITEPFSDPQLTGADNATTESIASRYNNTASEL